MFVIVFCYNRFRSQIIIEKKNLMAIRCDADHGQCSLINYIVKKMYKFDEL